MSVPNSPTALVKEILEWEYAEYRYSPQFLNFDFDAVPKMIRIRNTSIFINQNVRVELDPISIHAVERCRHVLIDYPSIPDNAQTSKILYAAVAHFDFNSWLIDRLIVS